MFSYDISLKINLYKHMACNLSKFYFTFFENLSLVNSLINSSELLISEMAPRFSKSSTKVGQSVPWIGP